MTGLCFVDANVLVRADDPRDAIKRSLAREWLARLWERRTGRSGVQVLWEYFVTATRKLPVRLPPEQVWQVVREFDAWDPQPVDSALLRRAFELHGRHQLAWWDSLIVAAAQAQHCVLLLTEDLQDGAVFGGVTVRAPIRLTVEEAVAQYGYIPKPRYRRRPSALRG